jgi:hypothetical protein
LDSSGKFPLGETNNMDAKISETVKASKDWANMKNVELAVTYAVFFGICLCAGYFLTSSGVFQ